MTNKIGSFIIIVVLIGSLLSFIVNLYAEMYKPEWAYIEIETRVIKIREVGNGNCRYFFNDTRLSGREKCGKFKVGDKLELKKVEE